MTEIVERERRCIELTMPHYLPKQSSLIRELGDPILDLRKEPLWLLPVFVPLFIVFIPVSVLVFFMNKREYRNTLLKYRQFAGYPGEKHILHLWRQYGLKTKRFSSETENRELASCLSTWISILYEEKFHLSAEQIMDLFKKESGSQWGCINRVIKIDMHCTFKSVTAVVIGEIMRSLPNYDDENDH